MADRFLDNLAKKLRTGGGSRRGALALMGAALSATALPPLLPQDEEAVSRRKCHKKKGLYMRSGDCHCTNTCDTHAGVAFHCHNRRNCFCSQTVSGEGFCIVGSAPSSCTTDAECPTADYRCVATFDCSRADVFCTGPADCGGGLCLNDRCMTTYCATACPT